MNKAERLLEIFTYLRSRRTAVTALTLADRFNVSERTIYRDVQSLILSGVPIEGEAGIGYLVRTDASLAPLMFTEPQIEALMLGVRLVKQLGDDGMVGAADEALTKIRAVIPEPLMQRLNHKQTSMLVPEYGRDERIQHGELIRHAITQCQVLNLQYKDGKEKISERNVEPLGLVLWGMTWILVAWCQLRQDYRSFRLDRIKGISTTQEYFAANDERSFQAYLQQYDGSIDTQFWSH